MAYLLPRSRAIPIPICVSSRLSRLHLPRTSLALEIYARTVTFINNYLFSTRFGGNSRRSPRSWIIQSVAKKNTLRNLALNIAILTLARETKTSIPTKASQWSRKGRLRDRAQTFLVALFVAQVHFVSLRLIFFSRNTRQHKSHVVATDTVSRINDEKARYRRLWQLNLFCEKCMWGRRVCR